MFLCTKKAGTLSGVAEILHLSQPALSRNMKKLEDELGVILFDRKKNKLELNKTGEYVLKLAKELLEGTDSFAAKPEILTEGTVLSPLASAPLPQYGSLPL